MPLPSGARAHRKGYIIGRESKGAFRGGTTTGEDGHGFRSYFLGNLLRLGLQEDVCPQLHEKLAHCRSDSGAPQLTVAKDKAGPKLIHYDQKEVDFVDDDCSPVVLDWAPVADELLVGDGRYEVAWQRCVYEVSQSGIIVKGRPSPSYLEHQVLRPLVNNAIVPRGALLVHGGAVRIDGKVALLLGESGKTSLVLGLMARGAEFIGDEHVYLDSRGICTMYTPFVDLDDCHFTLFPELLQALYPEPRERRKVERRLSFFQMGVGMSDGNALSRGMRNLLMTRSYVQELACRFDRPFPRAKMCESAPVHHAFHLVAGSKGEMITGTSAIELARLETASTFVHQGFHYHMARLAGIPSIGPEDMERAYAGSLGQAPCSRLRISLRQVRTRDDIERQVDAILMKMHEP